MNVTWFAVQDLHGDHTVRVRHCVLVTTQLSTTLVPFDLRAQMISIFV